MTVKIRARKDSWAQWHIHGRYRGSPTVDHSGGEGRSAGGSTRGRKRRRHCGAHSTSIPRASAPAGNHRHGSTGSWQRVARFAGTPLVGPLGSRRQPYTSISLFLHLLPAPAVEAHPLQPEGRGDFGGGVRGVNPPQLSACHAAAPPAGRRGREGGGQKCKSVKVYSLFERPCAGRALGVTDVTAGDVAGGPSSSIPAGSQIKVL